MYKYQILHYNMPYLYTHFQLSTWIFLINLHDPEQTIETATWQSYKWSTNTESLFLEEVHSQKISDLTSRKLADACHKNVKRC